MAAALSVVIAACGDAAGLRHCVDAFRAELGSDDELVVVGAPQALASLADGLHDARLRPVPVRPPALVPVLWSRGMEAATAPWIATTTSHFEPAPGWRAAAAAVAAEAALSGCSGPIEPPRRGAAAAWATYFLRYSNTLALRDGQTLHDLPADNAVYAAAPIRRHWTSIRAGFWEPGFHRRVLADGGRLAWHGALRVVQTGAWPWRDFCRQRLLHGREFGSSRIRDAGPAVRAVRVLLAPLIPFVYLGKITARVVRHGQLLAPFLRASPMLALFVSAWALGEAWGYLCPLRDDRAVAERATA